MKRVQDNSSSGEESDENDEDPGSKTPVQKKHKKHKHKKHKRKKSESSTKKQKSSQETSSKAGKGTPPQQMPSTSTKPNVTSALSLMLKYNEKDDKDVNKTKKTETVESPVQKYVDKIGQGLDLVQVSPQSTTPKSASRKKRTQRKDSETSSEEERWLDAIQSGKLEEVDEELKKIRPKDPKLMTARQRAMFERKTDKDVGEQLMALPSGYKEVVMTAEAIQRKAIKSQKRKQMADEKREKDKKKTMERLLKKQESKTIKAGSKKLSRKTAPQITYLMTTTTSSISLPPGYKFPWPISTVKKPPDIIKCGVSGCSNAKKYSCSKTGVPLCSLNCYKINLKNYEISGRGS